MRRRLWTTPQTSATYSLSTSRSWNWRASSWCARSCLATTITPEVPLSSRCTMPGRCSPPMPLRSLTWCSSAWTSVPDACPAPGCTTSPAGLLTTTTSESSKRMSSGRSSATRSAGAASGTSTSTASPVRTGRVGLGLRHPGQPDAAIVNQALDLGPRVAGDLAGEELVEPQARRVRAGTSNGARLMSGCAARRDGRRDVVGQADADFGRRRTALAAGCPDDGRPPATTASRC